MSAGGDFILVFKCMLSWAEDRALTWEPEVPAVILFDEILCRAGDLVTAPSQALLMQEGLVQSKHSGGWRKHRPL